MLLPLVALLLLAQGESSWDRRERLAGEDLAQVKAELRKQDPTLEYFQALDKRPIDSVYSLLLVNAAPLVRNSQGTRSTPDFRRGQIGLFVVTGLENQVYMVLDRYPTDVNHPWPSMEPPTQNAAYLHAYDDYRIYLGSTKYFYDLHSRRKTGKIEYQRMALKVSARGGGRLYYAAGTEVYPRAFRAVVTVEPREKSPPVFDVRPLKGEEPGTLIPGLGRKPVKEFDLGGGRSLALIQHTPGPELDGIAIKLPRRDAMQYPVPVVDLDFYMKVRAPLDPLLRRNPSQRPLEIENRIGPCVMEGSTLWFASTFYDGEGMSGLGAIGTFDAGTRKCEMRYFPEIVCWSGSALRLDGDDVWVGLARRPEGAVFGGGLLRFNRKTRSARTYPVKDVIYTIDRVGDALYLGTSHGLHMLRGETLTQYRFEPDERGRIHVVARHAIDGR
jgi:hypothetical protein